MIKQKIIPSMDELKIAIKEAVKNTVKELFEINEDFYFLVLVTTGQASPPYLSAVSIEGLKRVVNKYVEEYRYDPNDSDLEISLKWSFADSPYVLFGCEKYFKDVESLFYLRPSLQDRLDGKMTEKEWLTEYDLRLEIMLLALKELDEEDVFERSKKRKNCFLNVSPECLNVKRTAFILNNSEIVNQVIKDGGLEEDGVE
jgi:hypothetical protein